MIRIGDSESICRDPAILLTVNSLVFVLLAAEILAILGQRFCDSWHSQFYAATMRTLCHCDTPASPHQSKIEAEMCPWARGRTPPPPPHLSFGFR